jgi:hypothetical protein
MKFLLPALVLISSASVANDDFQQQCNELYQGWVLNSFIEEQCGFAGMLSYRLGILVKSACDDNLPEELRNTLTLEIARAFKKDYETMGKTAQCEALKPGYEQAVDDLSETFNGDDLK